MFERIWAPNHVVEGLLLPDSPGSAEVPVDLMRREGLPGMEDPCQGETFVWCSHGMHMIWHHHPPVKGISLPLEVQECGLDDPGQVLIGEDAGPSARRDFGVLCNDLGLGAFGNPPFLDVSGNSVLEAEGDEEGAARFLEVGEISSALTRRERKLTGIQDSFTRQRTTWFVERHICIVLQVSTV